MSATNIRALKHRFRRETIYVVGSGASLQYVPPTFFDDKITVVVNEAYQRFGLHLRAPSFVLMHHYDHAQAAIDAGGTLVTSEHESGFSNWPAANFRGDYYTYKTAENVFSATPTINLEALERDADDTLVISPCTVAEAVHFAYHLGASAIVLCGIDGGSLDGLWNYPGYNGGGNAGTNPQHIRLTEGLLLEVVRLVRARGVFVGSLLPFINAGLEGHRYERPKRLTGHALLHALSTPGGGVITPTVDAVAHAS